MKRIYIKKGENYYHPCQGEWTTIKWKGGKRRCCDCGLVELAEYRTITVNGVRHLQMRGWRDEK